MADKTQEAAKKFIVAWTGKGYEKGESQPFWLSLLRDVGGELPNAMRLSQPRQREQMKTAITDKQAQHHDNIALFFPIRHKEKSRLSRRNKKTCRRRNINADNADTIKNGRTLIEP